MARCSRLVSNAELSVISGVQFDNRPPGSEGPTGWRDEQALRHLDSGRPGVSPVRCRGQLRRLTQRQDGLRGSRDVHRGDGGRWLPGAGGVEPRSVLWMVVVTAARDIARQVGFGGGRSVRLGGPSTEPGAGPTVGPMPPADAVAAGTALSAALATGPESSADASGCGTLVTCPQPASGASGPEPAERGRVLGRRRGLRRHRLGCLPLLPRPGGPEPTRDMLQSPHRVQRRCGFW